VDRVRTPRATRSTRILSPRLSGTQHSVLSSRYQDANATIGCMRNVWKALGLRDPSTIAISGMLVAAALATGLLEQYVPAWPTPQPIRGSRSVEQKLDDLTRVLRLTASQRREVLPVLNEHRDKVQALFNEYPALSRQDLAPQINVIGSQTHREIDALLTPHQEHLIAAIRHRRHGGKQAPSVR
jgi:hypothetical protein